MRMLLAVAVFACGACFDIDTYEPETDTPLLEYINVDATYGENGRTFIGWSHADGPNAVLNQPGTVRFTSRSGTGPTRVVEVTQPFDSRVVNRMVEFEYRHGREVMEIRVTQQDRNGRTSAYDCFGPEWRCFRQ